MKNFERITVDPAQMGGVPCVRHLRIPVATVLRLLASGLTEAAILSEYPDLQAGRYSRVLTLRRGFGDGAGTAPPAFRLKFLIDNPLPECWAICGADPLVCAGPPGPALLSKNELRRADVLLPALKGLEPELPTGCVAVFRNGRLRVRRLPFSA